MTEAAGPDPAPAAPQYRRRNYLLYAIEGSLFIASLAFINPQTVLPALVVELGGDNIAVGALSIFVYFGLFLPQLLSARQAETMVWKKQWTLRAGLIPRYLVLCMAAVVMLLGSNTPVLARWLVIGLFAVIQMCLGYATPAWYDMFAKLVRPSSRGRLVGIRAFGGGAGAFLCGVILTWLLSALPFPFNYGSCITAAFILQMFSYATQKELVEDIPSNATPRRSLKEFFAGMIPILRSDLEFRRFLTACAILTLAAMPIGFYAVYALGAFQTDSSVIGEFTLTIALAQMGGALVSGYFADRLGNKSAILIGGLALLLASITALVAPNLAVFRLVFVFLGINLGTEIYARYNIAIEFCEPSRRSTYIGLMNTLIAPFYLSGLFGGVLGALIGLRGLFAVASVFSIAGVLYMRYRVSQPGKPQSV